MPAPTSALPEPRGGHPCNGGFVRLSYWSSRPLGVADVGKLLGVNRSSAHRFAPRVEDYGYVVRDEATRQYTLARNGPGLLSREGLGRHGRRPTRP